MLKHVYNFILLAAAAILIIAAIVIFTREDKGDNAGAAKYTERERELLQTIGEYQQREQTRIREEAERLAAERERIERTEAAIDSLRKSDRRSSDLYEQLEQEIDILENYFRQSNSLLNNNIDSNRSN